MRRLLPMPSPSVRQLLLAFLAIGLFMRVGAGCEAMSAVAAPVVAADSHCADRAGHGGEPVKPSVTICGLCVALPDTMPVGIAPMTVVGVPLVGEPSVQLEGLDGGPAPPPPRA